MNHMCTQKSLPLTHTRTHAHTHTHTHTHVGGEWEGAKESSVCVWHPVWLCVGNWRGKRERSRAWDVYSERQRICVCVKEREKKRERERARARACLPTCACVCVCMCTHRGSYIFEYVFIVFISVCWALQSWDICAYRALLRMHACVCRALMRVRVGLFYVCMYDAQEQSLGKRERSRAWEVYSERQRMCVRERER